MRLNNKGYTLTELLITLAIFSVVMLGIIQIMSTTSATYRDENFEINMQTQASMLMSQMDELLMDCKDIIYTDGVYEIVSSEDKVFYLTYDKKAGEVKLSKNNKKYEVLANNISSFEIEGLKGKMVNSEGEISANASDTDNACTVEVFFDNNGATYSATKQIYFRNYIEDNSKHALNMDDGTPVIDNSDVIVRDVKRYEIVNLEKEYGIVSDYFYWDPNSKGGFRFMDGDYTEDVPNECPTDVLSGFITTSLTYNNDHMDFITKDDGVYISGLNAKGQEIKVFLTISEVKLIEDSGILEVNVNGLSEQGTYSWVNFEGFDVKSAIIARKKIPWSEQVYYDNVAYEDIIARATLDMRTTEGVANPEELFFKIGSENTCLGYNCFADPYSQGIVLVSCAESFRNVTGGENSADANKSIDLLTNHKIEMEFSFELPGRTSAYTTRKRVLCGGCDLSDMY